MKVAGVGQGPEERKSRRFGPVPVGSEHWEVCLAARCAGLPVCSFMGGRTEKPGREMSAAGIAMMVYMVGHGPGHLYGRAGKVKWEGGNTCCLEVRVRKGGSRVQDYRGLRPESLVICQSEADDVQETCTGLLAHIHKPFRLPECA